MQKISARRISNFHFKKLPNGIASISALIRPHKKAACLPARQVKKIEAQDAKEKQMLLKLGLAIGSQVAQKQGVIQLSELVFL